MKTGPAKTVCTLRGRPVGRPSHPDPGYAIPAQGRRVFKAVALALRGRDRGRA